MADLTPYAITLGATDYPIKYAGLLGYLDSQLTSVQATAPNPSVANQVWLDTSTTPQTLRQRNAGNTAWIEIGRFDQTANSFQAALIDGAVTTAKIADSSVTTAKIADSSVTTAKLAPTIAPNVSSLNGGPLAGFRNLIIDGGFNINQRAAATNADDTYAHDRWYALTQTGTIAVTTLNNVADGTPFMARLTQSQATAQRMGYAQIIEGINCRHLRGREVTFRLGGVRLSTASNVRMAVLEWTGTEDAVTSDVVNNWTATVYTAGNFFLASNLTVSGVVQQALTANTLTNGSAVTVTLGSSFNNLIVFVWTESAVAQNVTLDLGKAQLEIGSVATPFEDRPIGAELALCQRYLPSITGAVSTQSGSGAMTSTTQAWIQFKYPVSVRAPATGISVSAASDWALWWSGADLTATGVTFTTSTNDYGTLLIAVASGATTNAGCALRSRSATAQILFTGCEL